MTTRRRSVVPAGGFTSDGRSTGCIRRRRDYTGTGDHYEARVVSPDFAGKAMVQQHQLVYAPLQQWLKSGELHALALKTYSPEQWKKLGTR